ncbi:MAG: YbdK family carboxylate-amine ligase [Thermodesulfobacteriota bacterium]
MSLGSLVFAPSPSFSIGVEVELQLVDRQTLDLAPRAPAILAAGSAELPGRLKPELIQSMIELTTPVCAGMDEVAACLGRAIRALEVLAAREDCSLLAASLHPFAASSAQPVTDAPRYRRIRQELALVGRQFITQGLHVHVGLPDGELAVRVCDGLRLHLPVLLALSTSSPFFEGSDTGLFSYRSKLCEALPLAGLPDRLGDWQGFVHTADLLARAGIITSVRDLWWDIRPHPTFGTVEVRICDLPSRLDEILALVSLIQALVVTLSRQQACPLVNMQILRANKWQAARHGLDGVFIEPWGEARQSLRTEAAALVDLVMPAALELGGASFLHPLARILRTGTSAHRQRQIHAATGDLGAVVLALVAGFWQGSEPATAAGQPAEALC